MHYLQSRLKGLLVPIAISVLLVGVFIFGLLSFAGVNDKDYDYGASSCPPPDPKSMVQDEDGLYPFDQVLMYLATGQDASRAEQIAKRYRGHVQCVVATDLYQLKVPSKNAAELQQLIQKIETEPGVELVFHNDRTENVWQPQ